MDSKTLYVGAALSIVLGLALGKTEFVAAGVVLMWIGTAVLGKEK